MLFFVLCTLISFAAMYSSAQRRIAAPKTAFGTSGHLLIVESRRDLGRLDSTRFAD
jgi:hypothetical protein